MVEILLFQIDLRKKYFYFFLLTSKKIIAWKSCVGRHHDFIVIEDFLGLILEAWIMDERFPTDLSGSGREIC